MDEITEGPRESARDLYAGLYSVICDAVERAWHNWPVERGADEAPVLHTSSYAREAANRVMDVVGEIRDVDTRTDDEIQAAEQEYFDRLWYYRTMSTDLRNLPEAQDGIRRIEANYKDLKIDPVSVANIEGKLSALRWVLGDDWDMLDT